MRYSNPSRTTGQLSSRIKSRWVNARSRKEETTNPTLSSSTPSNTIPGATAQLLEVLHYAGLDIHQASESFEAEGETFAAGSHVVLMAQPFRAYAKDLLEIQKHPTPSDYPTGTMRGSTV